jgi:hypothetical protein
MHLQARVRLASGTQETGVGAMTADGIEADPIHAQPGALADLADAIAGAGINIRLVAGQGIETGGELLLAVGERDEDRLKQVLTAGGYVFSIFKPTHEHLPDEPGSLAKFARNIANQGRLIDTIAVGTPGDEEGAALVPVQARTINVSGARANSSEASPWESGS